MTAVAEILKESMHAWRPPPRLNLDTWADEHFYLSAESSAEAGRWRTLPYQRGVMRAITDPSIERVTLMKSARVGFTKLMGAAIGYHMHQDPCPIMVVQPTLDDARGYSKQEIAPMLRDCPALAAVAPESRSKNSASTILIKAFTGGILQLVGANSARGFRRVSARVIIFDEVDGYPPSAGSEGDQIRLGIMRTQTFHNRKILAGSTPTISGASRIESMFEAGDQRRYYVPCPHCAHMDFFTFRESDTLGGAPSGHFMTWPEGEPEKAHFNCRGCGAEIDHAHKRTMVELGEWRAHAASTGHASFHIWAAYSYSPNATWVDIAKEHDAADREGPQAMQTFVNTVLGQTWKVSGEEFDFQKLYYRRESYEIGSVPVGVRFLTAGIDTQKDRLVYEVVGWGLDKQSWSIDAGVLMGDTSSESGAVWLALHDLLERAWPGADGLDRKISVLAIDSGWNTNTVYSWARRYPGSRVMATKGVATQRTFLRPPSDVDVKANGKKLARAYKIWPLGVGKLKEEFFGWLGLQIPEAGSSWPIGFCHFPEYGEDYFKQITAEQLVATQSATGHSVFTWQVIPGRQNHWLDCRVMARAAASMLGLDRAQKAAPPSTPPPSAPSAPPSAPAASQNSSGVRPAGWLGGRGQNFLKRRR